jgi:NAD(P)-dependent dehydrogenase (short-subunit alcohol dehydrogenase family)
MCFDVTEGLDETVAEIRRRGKVAEGFRVDVGDEAAVSRAFGDIARLGHTVDGLVTCAGVHSKVGILDLTVQEWERVMGVNLRGTFLCVQGALRTMVAEGRGRIVTIASDTGKRGGGKGGKAAYGASKGGVLAFTRSIAREIALLKADIRINSVCPGPMLTNMHAGMTEEFMQRYVDTSVPMGRFATPDEVADGVLYLLSDHASYVYGETLSVDGGVLMD